MPLPSLEQRACLSFQPGVYLLIFCIRCMQAFIPFPPSWWNAPVMDSGQEGQMGHLLDILLLPKHNQRENNWKEADNNSLLIIQQGHLGLRCRVPVKYIWKLNSIFKKFMFTHGTWFTRSVRLQSYKPPRRRHERPKINSLCIMTSFTFKIKSPQSWCHLITN